MAFSTLTEIWGAGQDSSLDPEGETSSAASRTMESFSDDPANDTEATFRSILPGLGSIHPRLGISYILRRRSIQRMTPVRFQANLSYDTNPSKDPDNQTYPWDEPAKISYSTSNATGMTEIDADGVEIATVNGEVFAVSKEFADQAIQIEQNFLGYEPEAFYEFMNAVNSDGFLGFPAGVLRITGISATVALHEETYYWKVTVTILARRPLNTTAEKAWWYRAPQKGTLILPKVTSTKAVIALEGGRKVTQPIMILANGTKKKDSDPIYFIEKKIYDSVGFSGMNLIIR